MSGRQRQPIELVQAKKNKHLTKAEIAERKRTEVKPIADNIEAPDYLTKSQKEDFNKYAEQLQKLKIMGETDVDALARYVVSNSLYIDAIKKLRSKAVADDPYLSYKWSLAQERYFKQCRISASDLGLTIASRCKLVIPEVAKNTTSNNKFSKFEKRSVVNE